LLLPPPPPPPLLLSGLLVTTVMFMFLDVDFIVIVLARESALVAATPKQLLQDEIRQSFKKRFSTLLRNT
jgi:hypothetical protein